jgi:hypothetical protein
MVFDVSQGNVALGEGSVAVQVTIDAGSKSDAELIARELPGQPEARSWRGYGVVRLRFRKDTEAHEVIPLVADCVERHGLAWARVRVGDDERMFRTRKQRAS